LQTIQSLAANFYRIGAYFISRWSKWQFLNNVMFLYRTKHDIFTMTILFSWKSGRAILHHKSESFNYSTDNDDKRCVIRMRYRCHCKERICSQSAICVSAQDKTHWWLIDTPPSSIFIELMLWLTSGFWKFIVWSG